MNNKNKEMKAIKLSVAERFLLMGILPLKGSRVNVSFSEDLLKKLGFSLEELAEFEIRNHVNENTFTWNTKKEREKEISFKSEEVGFLLGLFKQMDLNESLTIPLNSLYSKIETLVD